MSKILISPLGPGHTLKGEGDRREYATAKYKFEGVQSVYETSFIAAALAEHFDIDKIFFIGTVRSMWEGVYEYFAENGEGKISVEYYTELSDKIKDSSRKMNRLKEEDLAPVNSAIDNYLNPDGDQKGGSKCKIIRYGINEEEIWKNFDAIMSLEEKFSHGDEIYLDITHSFRSIPMFMYLLMDFVQTLKPTKVQLKGIYYGMLQVNGELEYAPVVDLSPLFEISKWIRGVYDFKNYGNGYLISDLMKKEEMSDRLERVSDLVNINLLENLSIQIRKLRNLIENTSSNKVFKYIEPEIKSFLDRFADIDEEWKFQFEISSWYAENKDYVNGYICLAEAILTFLCDVYDLDSNDFEDRRKVKGLVASSAKARRYSHNKAFKELNSLFKKINKVRKNVAHGGISQNMRNADSDISNFEKYQDRAKKLLEMSEVKNLSRNIPL